MLELLVSQSVALALLKVLRFEDLASVSPVVVSALLISAHHVCCTESDSN